MNKYKNKLIAGGLIIGILLISFIFGGNVPKESTVPPAPSASPAYTPIATEAPPTETPQPTVLQTVAPVPSATPMITPSPAPTATPVPEAEKELICTISVRCDTVLSNMSFLTPGKQDIIPADGVILQEKTAVFYEGESVFNVLVREARQNNIHLEFVNTPFYNSAYIEGIGNLYEFDCGELSGWMYRVNGVFPNFGCSQYTVEKGDKIEWVYTCNSGADVGDTSGTRNGLIKDE